MKIGIIYTAFNTEDLIEKSLTPWIQRLSDGLDSHRICICAVNVPFKDFPTGQHDNTNLILNQYYINQDINTLIDKPYDISEIQARTLALKYLIEQGCDYIWQVDSDEFYTKQNIIDIINFIQNNPFISMFRVSYKNLVFTPNQYLAEPFTPARIHKVKHEDYELREFWADNNAYYLKPQGSIKVKDDNLSNMVIPTNIAWVIHQSWLNDERSKKKIEYQQLRWGQSSFKWDESKGGLIFNKDYYKSKGLQLPEVITSS